MTQSEFKDALKKGQGRCVMALKDAGALNRFKRLVLWACSRNLSLDAQCEGTRARYLADLIGRYRDKKAFIEVAERMIQVNQSQSDWVLQQSCELLGLLSRGGNAEARAALWRVGDEFVRSGTRLADGGVPIQVKENAMSIFSELMPLCHSEAEEDLIEAGVRLYFSGGVFAAEFREELQGIARRHSDRLAKRLQDSKAWGAEKARNGSPPTRPEQDDFKRLTRPRVLMLKRRGELDEVKKLAGQCAAESNWRIQAARLNAFVNSELVGFLPRGLVERLLESRHAESVLVARRVMAKIQSDTSLKLGRELLQRGASFDEAVEMVARNCGDGEGELLISALKRAGRFSRSRRHAIHSSVIRAIDETGRAIRFRRVWEFLVEAVECSSCRERCIRVLDLFWGRQRSVWEECLFDSSESLREFARERLRQA